MTDTGSVSVRVFSLNCWGIRHVSKHCSERYRMIAELLCAERFDIVLLQEVWSENDYLRLKKKLSCTHPHSHHFKSGVIGSGLALFSKHQIQDTFLYRFSLNGYPYMIHHGDWFGGKAVGLAVLHVNGLTLNVYVTHLHAEYNREKDSYLPHRVVQAWELQQVVRHTSAGADAVILGGDLNMHPQDVGNRLLRSFTGLKDAYTEAAKFDGCEGGVTLIAANQFINQQEVAPFGNGIRIDYILFKGSSRADVACDFMRTTKGSAAGSPFPYSDHEALIAELKLSRRSPAGAAEEPRLTGTSDDSDAGTLAALVDTVTEARTEVKVGLHCARRMLRTATRTALMGLALLLLELAVAAVPWLAPAAAQPFPRTTFYLLGALCFATLLCTALLYVFYSAEIKSLRGAEEQMRLAVAGLHQRLRGEAGGERDRHGEAGERASL